MNPVIKGFVSKRAGPTYGKSCYLWIAIPGLKESFFLTNMQDLHTFEFLVPLTLIPS